MTKTSKVPKVFISYSWTNGEHVTRVAELGTRLMNDGVDVALDQWSLEDCQDVTAFMESMVTDPSIDRILVVSDLLYAEKADGRAGGVGTETQIISQDVYADIKQTKVLPLLFERDEEGKACLPVFLKNRKYMDFSSSDLEEESYERLLRNLHHAPELTKPKLGKKPQFLSEASAVTSRASSAAKRLRSIVESGRGNTALAIDDYRDSMIETLEELRIAYSREAADVWCETIQHNIKQSLPLRDSFVEVCRLLIASSKQNEAADQISGMLELLLPFRYPKSNSGPLFEVSQDNYRFLCYEFFLYAIAVCIATKKFAVAYELIGASYLEPRDFAGEYSRIESARVFNDYARSIDEICAKDGNSRKLSLTGDWIKERATLRGVTFRNLCEADAVLAIHPAVYGWFPRSMVVSFRESPFDLFLRAETENGFKPLGVLLGLSSPKELSTLLNSEEIQKRFDHSRYFRFGSGLAQLNAHKRSEIWPT